MTKNAHCATSDNYEVGNVDIGPDLEDYRPLLRGWIYCRLCDEWYHPEEYGLHTWLYQHNEETGDRLVMHEPPKRRIDGPEG